MGNDQPKNRSSHPPLTKQQLEMILLKVKNHCEVLKERKINDISMKEKQLKNMIDSPNRSKSDEATRASVLVQDTRYFRALEITVRNAMILKEHSMFIVENLSYPERMNQYIPVIESLMFAEGPLNIKAIKEFEGIISSYLGPSMMQNIANSPNIDPELKKCCFIGIPNQDDIDRYLIDFCNKNSIDLVRLSQVGHNTNVGNSNGNVNPYNQQGQNPFPNNYNFPQQFPMNQMPQQGIPPSQNFNPPPQNFNPSFSNYIPPNLPQNNQATPGRNPYDFSNMNPSMNPIPPLNQPQHQNFPNPQLQPPSNPFPGFSSNNLMPLASNNQLGNQSAPQNLQNLPNLVGYPSIDEPINQGPGINSQNQIGNSMGGGNIMGSKDLNNFEDRLKNL